MPITVAHNIDPGLLGAVALLTGQGRNQQALAAQAADEAFRQAQLAEQVRARDIQATLAGRQLDQQGQQFDQRMLAADRDRQAQLFSNSQRGALAQWQTLAEGGMQQSMLRDRLGAGLLERQMMGEQQMALEQATSANRFAQQLHLAQQQEWWGQYGAESERLWDAQNTLDDDEFANLEQQFNDKWTPRGLPPFGMSPPEQGQTPLEEDPAAFASQMNEMLRENGFSPSAYVNPKDGSVDTIFGPDKDPVFLRRELETKLQIEQMKQQFKMQQEAERQKMQAEKFQSDARAKGDTKALDSWLQGELDIIGKKPDRRQYERESMDATGARTKTFDQAGYDADLTRFENDIRELRRAHAARAAELGGSQFDAPGGRYNNPQEAAEAIKAGRLKAGQTIQTPGGPYTVTQEDVDAAKGL